MSLWGHIIIEGFCMAQSDDHPCGRPISSFCLANGHCPYFMYADSNEREAAYYVPLPLIIWDKVKETLSRFIDDIKWIIWDKWHYDDSWLDNIPVAPYPKWDNYLVEASTKFEGWLRIATIKEMGK